MLVFQCLDCFDKEFPGRAPGLMSKGPERCADCGQVARCGMADRTEEHIKDEDCTVDPETGCCEECGVDHGGFECEECGGLGFHVDGCLGQERQTYTLPKPAQMSLF